MKKNISIIFLAAVILILVGIFIGNISNSISHQKSLPHTRQKPTDGADSTPTPSQSMQSQDPVAGDSAEDQSNSQGVSMDSCRDGNMIRENVKNCSTDLECYSLTPMNERYCRLPDGACKFFCTDK